MMFELHFSHQATKFLKNCSSEISQRIVKKIVILKEIPVPHDAKRIVGEQRVFRLRIGNYRIVYEIDYESNFILIVAVDKRSRVYQ